MLDATPLTGGWTLRYDGRALPAEVPGCVHTDLLAAGVIRTPFLGRGETDLTTASGHEQTDLVFEGLDTAAEIVLDGQLLGRVWNMHRSYRFDVTGMSGRLAVRFASAYTEAEAVRDRLGDRPNAYPSPSLTSARWPAPSAGTGGRCWSRPASGARCVWSTGRRPGSPGCARW